MLKKKMVRDLFQQKAQFFSIFMMCLSGMFIYSGIDSEWRGMKIVSDQLYEDCHMADALVYGTSEVPASAISETADSEARTLLSVKDDAFMNHELQLYAAGAGTLSSMKITAGIPYEQQQDGIWLDQEYASANGYQVGDTIRLRFDTEIIEKTILGLGYHPEYIYALKDENAMLPDHTNYGFAYLSKEQEPRLRDVPDNLLYIKAAHEEEALNVALEEDDTTIAIMRSEHPSVVTMDAEIAQHRSIGALFPVIFFLIAMLTTLNTMRKMILNQRMQLGTLKALGFTKQKLYFHYSSHILLVCSIGSILGMLCGPLIIPPLIYDMQKQMYALPLWKGSLDISVFLLCLVAIILCVGICIWSIHQEMRECAASCMREKIIASPRHALGNTLAKKHFYVHWNLRDLARNKARALMAVIGIMGCSALLVASLGLLDSIHIMLEDAYEVLQPYETKLMISQNADASRVQELQERYNATKILESTISVRLDEERKTVPLLVLEDTRYRKLDARHPETPLPQHGVSVAQKLAAQYDLQLQDHIRWKQDGGEVWYESEIVQVHQAPLGQGIIMSASEYALVTKQAVQPTALLCNEVQIAENEIITSVQSQSQLQTDMSVMLDAMQVLVGVLIFAAFVLGIIVLYNFTSLTYYERFHEMATLKVLGFSKKKIARLMMTQNLLLCVIGITLGISFGFVMVSFMASTLSEDMDLLVHIQPISFSIAILFTFVMVWGITKWYCRNISTIDMVSALKSPE